MSRKNVTLPGFKAMPVDALMSPAAPARARRTVRIADDPEIGDLAKSEKTNEVPSLRKSFLNLLDGGGKSIERLAFEADPTLNNQYGGIYKQKLRLIPDTILKRIAIQDDLIACIVGARGNHVMAFGRPREDRFSTGFIVEPKEGIRERADFTEERKEELEKRIDRAIELISTCGHTDGWKDKNKMSFPQYLYMSTRNAMVVGRLATEIIQTTDMEGKKKFHSFRPIDAGTIYRATNQSDAAQSVREQARLVLEQIKNEKLQPDKFVKGEYAWIQVIDSRPVQAFTEDECVVHNFYPVPDVELDGYPVTPIDTMISQVTMHINIVTHNKLYFQSGRATRGMLVIKSEDVDETVIARLRQQFNASINNVSNAWRMPVFGIGTEEELNWEPIDNSGQRDMEFQYLSDMNARSILSSFQMSPEELPGWAYLSRGTNNQALSESNNEYQLEAHRDLGIRPLLKQFEDFINAVILPLIDPELAKVAVFKLVGLDALTAEKESVRLQQDMPIHMTFNEALEKVEKKPIDKSMGGDYPLNPMYQAILDKHVPVGKQLEYFYGIKGASKDPQWAYVRDPFWFQQQQMLMQQQQMQQQAQAQQQAAASGQPPPDDGSGGGGEASGGDQQSPDQGGGGGGNKAYPNAQTEKQQSAQADSSAGGGQAPSGQDLTRALDQAIVALSKSEGKLPPSRRRLLAQHRKTVQTIVEGMLEDMRHAQKEIVDAAHHFTPKGK